MNFVRRINRANKTSLIVMILPALAGSLPAAGDDRLPFRSSWHTVLSGGLTATRTSRHRVDSKAESAFAFYGCKPSDARGRCQTCASNDLNTRRIRKKQKFIIISVLKLMDKHRFQINSNSHYAKRYKRHPR